MPSARETWTLDPGAPRGPWEIEVRIHPSSAGRLVVLMPGYAADIDGYAEKYVKLADMLAERGVGAVVRTGNEPRPGHDFQETCAEQARCVLTRALAEAERLCGNATPELCVMGYSAGASAMAACADGFPALRKLLLVAPSADAGTDAMKAGLSGYRGELYVVVGDNDRVVGRDLPADVVHFAPAASRREFVCIPMCDHQFRGAANGRVFSQAPLWAFAGDTTFPSDEGGIHLYD